LSIERGNYTVGKSRYAINLIPPAESAEKELIDALGPMKWSGHQLPLLCRFSKEAIATTSGNGMM
jgi:hypothetical protein